MNYILTHIFFYSPLKPEELQVLRSQYEKEGEFVGVQTKFNYAWVTRSPWNLIYLPPTNDPSRASLNRPCVRISRRESVSLVKYSASLPNAVENAYIISLSETTSSGITPRQDGITTSY
jgi:hypothetical protein